MTQRGSGILARMGRSLDTSAMPAEQWASHLERYPYAPRSVADIEQLASRLYGGQADGIRCGRAQRTLLELGLRNPSFDDEAVEAAERAIAAHLDLLPSSVSGAHCVVHFTTTGSSMTTEKVAKAVARDFDDAWVLYSGFFAKAPYLGSGEPHGKKRVEIRRMSAEGSATPDGPVELSNQGLATATARRWVVAHECFHLVQFAFGLDVKFPSEAQDDWWVEGSASWAAVYATSGGAAPDLFDDFDNRGQKPVFSEKYEAFPLWAYLSGFKSYSGKSATWAVDQFLKSYARSGKSDFALSVLLSEASPVRDFIRTSIFVGHYALAKWNGSWNRTGPWFDRRQPMPYLASFTNYYNGHRLLPPKPKPTRTTTISQPGDLPPAKLTLPGGTVEVYEYSFPPGKLKQFHLSLIKDFDALAMLLAVAVIDPAAKASPKFFKDKYFKFGKVAESLPTIDLEPTDSGVLVACVEGDIRPSVKIHDKRHDIDFELKVICT